MKSQQHSAYTDGLSGVYVYMCVICLLQYSRKKLLLKWSNQDKKNKHKIVSRFMFVFQT